MGTETKFIYSGLTGAPTMNNAAGQLIAVLDACLINGFGSTNITGGTLTGTLATLTMASAGSFDVDTAVEIAGATPSGLNGQWRVTAKTSTSISFACTVAAGSVTAAGTVKVAPLGWTKAFSGTNLAAYKSSDVSSTGDFLRVDDTAAGTVRVVGYETMSDVSTGTGVFPTSVQLSGGVYWQKPTNATNREWFVIGDTKGFYWGCAQGNGSLQMVTWFFGDIIPYRSGDAYACYLMGNNANYDNSAGAVGCAGYSTRDLASARGYAPRTYTGLGTSVSTIHAGTLNRQQANYSGSNSGTYDYGTTFPNPCDNGLILCEVQVYDGISRWRGEMPGLLHTSQYALDVYPTYTKVDGTGAYAGRKLMSIRCGAPSGATTSGTVGVYFFDLWGNWRT